MSSNLNKYLQEDNHEPTQPSYEQRAIEIYAKMAGESIKSVTRHVANPQWQLTIFAVRQTALLLEAEELLNNVVDRRGMTYEELRYKVEEFLRGPR